MFRKLQIKPKTREILITIGEIVLVAGIIFGVLMFIYSRVQHEADQTSGVKNSIEETTKSKDALKYLLKVNKTKQRMQIYKYTLDINDKQLVKTFSCSVASDIKPGKYITSKSYKWVRNGRWHKYNTHFGKNSFIQSSDYSYHGNSYLLDESYDSIGASRATGANITLLAADAYWVSKHCGNAEIVEVVKGSFNDEIGKVDTDKVARGSNCGWDPTDPEKQNPYKKMKKGTVVQGDETVTVEKDSKLDYLKNLIALDDDGNDITSTLKYDKFNTKKKGSYVVTYTGMTKSGKKLEIDQVFKVIDTLPPIVRCKKQRFTITEESFDFRVLNTEENVKKIEKKVKKYVVCNETDAKIKVSTVGRHDLEEGYVPVNIKAIDKDGNIGSCQVWCKIKIKPPKDTTTVKPTTRRITTSIRYFIIKKKHKKKKKHKEVETAEQEAGL